MGFFSPKNTPENAVKAQIDAKLAFINDKYTEIGRFVKLRMADKIEEPEVKNLIAQIDATLEELKNLNEQLLTIRGMKLCSGCGHEIPVNMAFCPNCGTKQPEMAQPVYQQPAQGGAVPMGAQPVIQNSQGYHNHPVSPAYTQPQANPVYGDPAHEFTFAQTETVTLTQVLEADIIMGNVPVELICQNHHLEWFQSNFAGPDTYLVPGVLPEQCLVTNATGAYGLAISEWMLGLWLGLQKDLFLYRDRQTQHKWDAITRQVRPVAGSRVLCVGMGDIGSNFAMRAHALGAEVVGVRRSVRPGAPCPDYCLRVVPQSELDAELPQADLVALSLPGTPETLHMFDAARLARCKQGAILLNVGRGSTVDCLALADAVHSGHLFGAALDVTDPEPLPSDHPLWSEPNVIITPHISGRFSLAKILDNIVEIFIHNLKLYAAGQPVDNQVSRTTHYVSGGSGGQRLVCGMP